MYSLISFGIYVYITLIVIINPFGMASIFYKTTCEYSDIERTQFAKKVAINSFMLYMGLILIGSFVLRVFGIGMPFIDIGGGLFLSYYAWNLLNDNSKISVSEKKAVASDVNTREDISFVPLTMPLTVGAGSMAVALSISGNIWDKGKNFIFILRYLFIAFIAIIIISFTIYVCYRYSGLILSKLGKTGTIIISKIIAFLLLAIGTEIIWEGIRPLILSLLIKK